MSKEKQLSELDEICEGVSEENGTLFTEVLSMDRAIERKVEECYELGCTRVQVLTILNKYSK